YVAAEAEPIPGKVPPVFGVWSEDGRVEGVFPVEEGGRRLGTLYLRASMAQLFLRMGFYAMVTLLVLVSSLLLAWLVALALRRNLARPVIELASTASAITHGQDYSLRARVYGDDELGRLTTAFNGMIERTESAVHALRESEERFRVMADGAPVLIWISDRNGACTWFNQ